MLKERVDASNLPHCLVQFGLWHPYPTADEREKWESLPSEMRSYMIDKGEEALDENWPLLPATLFLDYDRTGNRARYQKVLGQRRKILHRLIFAECAQGDGRFLDPLANAVWSICEESFWGLPAHLHLQEAGPGLPDVQEITVDLFAAETAARLSWVHYLLGSSLAEISDFIPKRILHEVRRRMLDVCLERDDFWWMGFPKEAHPNNWNPWINSNWLASLLLCEKDQDKRIQGVRKITRSLDCFVEDYPADGGCDEGPGYWNRAGASLFDCLELLHSATDGRVDLFDIPLIKEMGCYIYRVHIDDQWFVNFADASARCRPSPAHLIRYGRKVGEPKLKDFGGYFARKTGYPQNTLSGSVQRKLPAIFMTDGLKDATGEPPYLRDVWLPETQLMAARSNAGAPDGLYLAAKGGHNAESHNHNDIGNFIVFNDGLPVLIDVGVETYRRKTFSKERYEIWTMQSRYHNLPTINGVCQSPGRESCAADVEYNCSEKEASLHLDITSAWPTDSGIHTLYREITLLRGEHISVRDTWDLEAKPEELIFSLITPCQPEIASDGRIRLEKSELTDSTQSGDALVSFDLASIQFELEELALEDSRLQNVWGDQITRILLSFRSPKKTGELEITVSPL
ncbi:MAG: heparinase II/III family protein [Candidatus Brocadiia bacterium]